jgi:hypothetical protein
LVCPAFGAGGTPTHSDESSGRPRRACGRPSLNKNRRRTRSFSAWRRPCTKPARSSPMTTKDRRIASASSESATVSGAPLQRSTYRLVSRATLPARDPRLLGLDRRGRS